MYKLLIVDDEPRIVKWLYELFKEIKGEQLDIYRACSAIEALDWLGRTKIDIVLTDICMPGMDGMELLKRIHAGWPHCRVIFLTGYSEFEYAYTAIKYDCVNYLLKTEKDEVIVQAVERAIEQLEAALRSRDLADKARKQMLEAAPLLRKEYLLEVLVKGEHGGTPGQTRLDDLGISMDASLPFYMILGGIDSYVQLPEDGKLLNEAPGAFHVLVDEYLREFPHKVNIQVDSGRFLLLVQMAGEGGKNPYPTADMEGRADVLLRGRLEIIQEVWKKSLGGSLSFMMSGEPVSWSEGHERFRILKQLLDFASGFMNESLLSDRNFSAAGTISEANVEPAVRESLSQMAKLDLLESYLERGQEKEFFDLLQAMTGCLEAIPSLNNSLAQEIYYTVSIRLLSYINRWQLTEKIAFRIGTYKLTRSDEHVHWKEAAQYLRELCGIIFELQRNSRDVTAQRSIAVVQQYIREHMQEDLPLVRLAELVYLNPSYLSRLFKQVTGINLFEYILDARMDKAKKLLEETEVKVNEVAAQVGMGSPTYFGRVFKRYTGLTPQEYREVILRSK